MFRLLLPLITILFSGGCGDTNERGDTVQPSDGRYRPGLSTTWQWQLSGTLNTGYDVDLYDIDLFDSPPALIAQLKASGKKVICYFSAGSYEAWREDEAAFPAESLGNDLDGWPDEKWLDIRSTGVRTIMEARLDLAKQKGCDGVEPDNMDGYTNTPGFDLTAADQLDYNRFITEAAHARTLAVGLKNDIDQIAALVDMFDFAVNEQCFYYNECAAYAPFIEAGKPVFNAEYDVGDTASLCLEANALGLQTLILPLNLDAAFRISCQDEP